MWREIADEIKLRSASFRSTEYLDFRNRRRVPREDLFDQLTSGFAANSNGAADAAAVLGGDDRALEGLSDFFLLRFTFLRGNGVGKFLPNLNDHPRFQFRQVGAEVFLRKAVDWVHCV